MNENIMTAADAAQEGIQKPSKMTALLCKNVKIHNRRTSIRLEPEMWNALKEVAGIEHCSIHDLCGAVHDLKEEGMSFTASLRVFLMEYYRSAAKSNQTVSLVQRHIKERATVKIVQPTEGRTQKNFA